MTTKDCSGILYRLDFASGKSYIGVTTRTLKKRLIAHACAASHGSQWPVHAAWRKYGEPVAAVLAVVATGELMETEMRAIAVFGALSPGGYNLTIGGEAPMRGMTHSPESKARMRASRRGKTLSLEHRENIAAALRGRKRPPFSPEHREKLGASSRGMKRKPFSLEHREKLSAANRGKTLSPESLKKISAAKLGKPFSLEHCANISAGKLGKRFSPEHCANISAARKGIKMPPRSIEYRAKISAAAKRRWEAWKQKNPRKGRSTKLLNKIK